jgi:hypothetical protein
MPTDTKNKGPLLVSYGSGDINALPVEWRAKMGFRQEDQQMPLGYVLGTPNGDPPEPIPVIISEDRLIQTRTDERKRTSVVLNPPPPNGGIVPPGGGPPDSWTMVSEERVPWGQVATRTRAFVPDGSHLILTDDMLQAEQKNIGVAIDQVVLTCPLPGPQIVDTKWDEIASLVSTVKRRKLVAQIVDGETIVGGVWRQTSREGETATVASEVVVTRTLPSSTLTSTEFDQESTLVTTKQTKKEAANIIDGETISGGVWKKIFHKGETGLVAVEIEESRTLPGPAVASTRIDQDSTLINITRTKKETGLVVSGEVIVGSTWKKTYKDGQTQLIALETVENRTLPGTTVSSTKFDDQSVLVTTAKTLKQASTIVDGETIVGSVWTKRYHEGVSGLVATEIAESRTLPGPTVISWRIEENGTLVTISKTKKLTSTIVEGETATASLWTKTYGDGETTLISTEVVETRALPTPIVSTSKFDEDSTIVNITRQRKLESQVVTSETVTPTLWTKKYEEAESGLIATQVTETRVLPGATLITTRFDPDSVLVTIAKTKKKADQFTDGESIVGNVWTKTYRDSETGLVATEIRESRTIGSPTITSFRIDDDGDVVTIEKTKKLLNNIPEGEVAASATLWRKTYAEGETELVATEVVESRPLGGAAKTVTSFRIDDDGAIVTIKKVKKRLSDIDELEDASAILWTKVYAEGITGPVATEVTETRGLGGQAPVVKSSRLDRDGLVVNITRVKKRADTVVDPVESGNVNSWIKTYRENVDGLVATEVVETATLPGPNVVTTEIQPDGRVKTITKSRVFWNSVATAESIDNNVWTKTYKEGESGKLATQVIETLGVARNTAFTIPSAHVDSDNVVVTTTKSILDKTLITPSANVAGGIVTTVEQKEIDRLVSEEIKSQFTFLDKAKFSVSIENPLPQQFRSLGRITETTHVVAGVAIQPTLGAFLERSQEQIDKLLKRTTDKTIDTGNFPVTYVGKELTTEYGGLLLNTEKKIDLAGQGSIDIGAGDVTDKNVIRAKLERFGPYGVRERATHAGAFPVLVGGDVDPETNFVMRYTQQVVDEGAEASAGSGTVTEIKPLDAARSLKTVRTVDTTAIGAFKLSFPGTTDISIPPQLISLTGQAGGYGGGNGSYYEDGSYSIVGKGSGQMGLDGECHCSSSAMMDVTPVIKQVWGQNVPCMRYLFFILGPTVSYSTVLSKVRTVSGNNSIAAWPKFKPTSVNVTIIGGSGTATARAKKWFSDTITADFLGRPTQGGGSRSQGGGTGVKTEVVLKTITIPPTIHAAIGIATNSLTSGTWSAFSRINLGGVKDSVAYSTSNSFITPTTFAATEGQSTIPSGTFVHRMRVEPWRFGYFKVDCEVVSSADW